MRTRKRRSSEFDPDRFIDGKVREWPDIMVGSGQHVAEREISKSSYKKLKRRLRNWAGITVIVLASVFYGGKTMSKQYADLELNNKETHTKVVKGFCKEAVKQVNNSPVAKGTGLLGGLLGRNTDERARDVCGLMAERLDNLRRTDKLNLKVERQPLDFWDVDDYVFTINVDNGEIVRFQIDGNGNAVNVVVNDGNPWIRQLKKDAMAEFTWKGSGN